MKIALLTQGYKPDASEASNITIRLLAEELVKQGHEIVIFCNQIWDKRLIEVINGYKVIRKKSDYSKKIIPIFQLLSFTSLIKKNVEETGKKFDVIHNFSASPLLSFRALFAKRVSKGARLIQTIKAETSHNLTYVLTPILNMFDAVTVPTRFLLHRLNKFGLKKSKMKIIPSYIDTGKFKPRDKAKLKKKYKFNKKIALYYGHLSERKGISDFIKAAEIIKDKNIIFLLVTGSSDKHVIPYEKTIKEKNLGDKIKLIRTTKNIEEYVNLADAVVLPYPNLESTEAQPSCVLETMASKTPLITTSLPELREFLTEKEAVFAKPSDAADLANKIKFVLNGKINKPMLEAAHRKAILFDYKKIIKKYIELYER